MSQGLYLYCLARASLVETLAGEMLDGQNPPVISPFRDLAAVWSPVPLEEFVGDAASSRLGNLSWVGPRVWRHEKIVEGLMRQSPVVPARFGTIFSSWESLAQVLENHYGALAAFLAQVADKEEWAVKGLLNRAAAREAFFGARLAAETEPLAALAPGRRYLREQRLRSQSEQDLHRWLWEVSREMNRDLGRFASDLCERRVRPQVEGDQNYEMVLNWAFMVVRELAEKFKGRIDAANARHGQRGLIFECTGPWPPYSFSPALAEEAAS
jgi:hypothetical protein